MSKQPGEPALRAVAAAEKPEQPQKYVRVRSAPDAPFVEFDFAIGDPCLFVELILPPKAFKEFCDANQVSFMTPEQIEAVEQDMRKWRYGDETLMARHHSDKS